MKKAKKEMGRPRGETQTMYIHMRVTPELRKLVDSWRKQQEVIPNLSDSIRMMVEFAVREWPKK